MKSITTFDIVLVQFPFSDSGALKRRPALVLREYRVRGLGVFYVVCMITSQVQGVSFPDDVLVVDIASAGLPKPSLIRTAKIATIEETLILKKLGSLDKKDISQFKKAWRNTFSKIG